MKENALRTKAFLEGIGDIDYSFEMLPGGHDWDLWDRLIRRFIASLNLPKPEVRLL